MNQTALPMDLPISEEHTVIVPTRPEEARVRKPVRNQAEMIIRDLDSLI